MGTEPEEESSEEKPSQEQIKNSVNSGTNSSAHSSSSVPPDVILSTVAVAAIATVAVVIPTIENADTEVDFDVSFVNGILSYYIELYEASETEEYYAYVLENGVVIHQSKIENYQLSETLDGLLPYNEYLIEVRSGSPPLYVVSSYFIPAAPVWAELDYMSADYNNIEYSVILFGRSGDAEISLYDPEADEVVYSMIMVEGVNSGIISGLVASHLYVLNVTSETTILLSEETETMAGGVEWDHLIVNGLSVDYGVTVTETEDALYISMSDSSTSSLIYQRELMEGITSDVITGLEYNHTYMLTVYSDTWTFLSERIVIEGDPTVVTLGHLKVVDGKSIDYEVTVTGSRDVATAYLTDARTGAVVYTSVLSIGVNSHVISDLEFSHTYQFKVSSPKEIYILENVTTGVQPTDLALEKLEAIGTTIEYEIVMTGGQDAPKVYLYESEGGTLKHTANLIQGFNTGSITDLEFGHDYKFKVSSDAKTYVEETISVGERYELVYFDQRLMTIACGIVINDASNARLYLTDSQEQEIWETDISEKNQLVEYDTGDVHLANFEIYTLNLNLGDEQFILGEIEILLAKLNYLNIGTDSAEYSVTINTDDTGYLSIFDYEYGQSDQVDLRVGEITGTITGLSPGSNVFISAHTDHYGSPTIADFEIPFPAEINSISGGPSRIYYDLWIDPEYASGKLIQLYVAQSSGGSQPDQYKLIDLTSKMDPDGNISGVEMDVNPGNYNEIRLIASSEHKTLTGYPTVAVGDPIPAIEFLEPPVGGEGRISFNVKIDLDVQRELQLRFLKVNVGVMGYYTLTKERADENGVISDFKELSTTGRYNVQAYMGSTLIATSDEVVVT